LPPQLSVFGKKSGVKGKMNLKKIRPGSVRVVEHVEIEDCEKIAILKIFSRDPVNDPEGKDFPLEGFEKNPCKGNTDRMYTVHVYIRPDLQLLAEVREKYDFGGDYWDDPVVTIENPGEIFSGEAILSLLGDRIAQQKKELLNAQRCVEEEEARAIRLICLLQGLAPGGQ
jgi:hypothetical protein